jgi:hypothetical protein
LAIFVVFAAYIVVSILQYENDYFR